MAEVLLARGSDSAALESALAPCSALAKSSVDLTVWPQEIQVGAVGPR